MFAANEPVAPRASTITRRKTHASLEQADIRSPASDASSAVLTNHGADDRILVGKTSYTPAELSAYIDAYLAVSNEAASNADARAFRDQVQGYVIAQHRNSDPILLQYGFPHAGPKKTTAATQAVAVIKRRATRKARGTMGKNAKAKIKGVVDPRIEPGPQWRGPSRLRRTLGPGGRFFRGSLQGEGCYQGTFPLLVECLRIIG